jgi:hypothetical protein
VRVARLHAHLEQLAQAFQWNSKNSSGGRFDFWDASEYDRRETRYTESIPAFRINGNWLVVSNLEIWDVG